MYAYLFDSTKTQHSAFTTAIMCSYLFDPTRTQHPATHLNIHNFLRITNIKNVFYINISS